MHTFEAELYIIVGNPYVYVPEEILKDLFVRAGKSKGPIPIRGTLNGKPYTQTLVKYAGDWRLYVNMKMLKDSPRRIGERITVSVEYDPVSRDIAPHPKWLAALGENPEAQQVFDGLRPSLQKEIVRYITNLKSEESVDRNVKRGIDFLLGKGRFVGRDDPWQG